MAVPFLAIAGYHALLDSRAGRFVEPPGPEDPGWRAIVDPSPLTAVVEMTDGTIGGIALLAGHADADAAASDAVAGGGSGDGGTVILVPGTLQVDGAAIGSLTPEAAVDVLGRTLRLRIGATEVVAATDWERTLGTASYTVANPDPVVDDDGNPLLTVGEIEITGGNAEVFLGRPAEGADPITLMFRRELFWAALLADPPPSVAALSVGGAGVAPEADAGTDGAALGPGTGPDAPPLALALRTVVGPAARVVDLPVEALGPDPEPDLAAAEQLVREVVPVPAGAAPGDRLQVRVIDRTGDADLAAAAARVASNGFEVVEIGNANDFDGGLTQLVVPAGLGEPGADGGITALADLAGATTVLEDVEGVDVDPVVTLLIGSDYLAGNG